MKSNALTRVLSLALCLALLCTLLPQVLVPASAEEPVYSGSCGAEGDNLSWVYDPDTYTLTITGTGAMEDWDDYDGWYDDSSLERPWPQDVKTLILGDGVTAVGRAAFAQSGVQEVIKSAGTLELHDWAFNGCEALERLSVEDGISFLGRGVFSGCRKLPSLKIAAAPAMDDTSIFWLDDFGALFAGCVSFQEFIVDADNPYYSVEDGVLYNKDKTKLIFWPPGKKGVCTVAEGVKEIGAFAFCSCGRLTDILLPEGLERIDPYAFFNLRGVHSLKIPEGVRTLEGLAFDSTEDLVTVELPESLTKIKARAFYFCEDLLYVRIPAGVQEIQAPAFSYCDKLDHLIVHGENQVYRDLDGVLYSKDGKTLIAYPKGRCDAGGYRIPAGVTEIKGYSEPSYYDNLYQDDWVFIPSTVEIISAIAAHQFKTVFYEGDAAAWDALLAASGLTSSDFQGNTRTIHLQVSDPEGHWGTEQDFAPSCEHGAFRGWRCPCGYERIAFDLWDSVKAGALGHNYVNGVCTRCGKGCTVGGDCGANGDNVQWSYDTETKTLTLTGTGRTQDWDAWDENWNEYLNPPPWHAYRTSIQRVVIGEGISYVGVDAFYAVHPDEIVAYEGVSLASRIDAMSCHVYFNGTPEQLPANLERNTKFVHYGVTDPDSHWTVDREEPATCTNYGYRWEICSCGGSRRLSLNLTPHEFDEGVYHEFDEGVYQGTPSCEGNLYISYTCKNCGYDKWEQANLPHQFGPWTLSKAPACLVRGEYSRSCAQCGKLETSPVTSLWHDYRNGTCTRCGEQDPAYVPEEPTPVDPTPVEPTPAVAFSDVPEGAFYAKAVAWAVSQNPAVTKGTGDGKFSPSDTCTRGQVVTFLWRAMGCPEPKTTANPFTDVKQGAFYYKAVLWAVENGITSGTGEGRFSPEEGCTRAQVVTFLWRTEGKPGAKNPASFSDVAQGAFYAKAVAWAVEQGITKGTGDGKFEPNQTCTRGQVVTFLYRDLA